MMMMMSVSLSGSERLNTRFLKKPRIPATSNPFKLTQHHQIMLIRVFGNSSAAYKGRFLRIIV